MQMIFRDLNKSCSFRPVAILNVLISIIVIGTSSELVQADTSAQVGRTIQTICNRASTSFGKRDLSGFMAMYSPSFTLTSIPGRVTNYRQTQAGVANAFADNHYSATVRCIVSQVFVQGNHAKAVLNWHYVSRYTSNSPSQRYEIRRDYEEQSLWEKSSRGWLEVASDITHDVLDYHR